MMNNFVMYLEVSEEPHELMILQLHFQMLTNQQEYPREEGVFATSIH